MNLLQQIEIEKQRPGRGASARKFSLTVRHGHELIGHYAAANRGWHCVFTRARMHLSAATWRAAVRGTTVLKRTLDVVGAASGLVLLAPVFAAAWLAIRLEDGGPAFFVQQRVGRHGEPFPMFKFRSMVANAEQLKSRLLDQNESAGGVLFKIKHDPRITRVGRIIRKLSIDELPQLVNVLRGEMSLVGPRPALPGEVARWEQRDRVRLEAKPGITCLWQIGGRSDIDFQGQVRLDVEYIRTQSFWTDVRILLKTIPVVVLGRGAY